MSDMAIMVELVENAAEADAAAGRPPDAQTAIQQAMRRATTPMSQADTEQGKNRCAIMAERYGLFYGAKRAVPEEAADVIVRRWRELQG